MGTGVCVGDDRLPFTSSMHQNVYSELYTVTYFTLPDGREGHTEHVTVRKIYI